MWDRSLHFFLNADIQLSQHHVLKILLFYQAAFVKNQLATNIRVYFWILKSVPLIYVYPYASTKLLITVDYNALKSGNESSSTLFFVKNFGYSVSFDFHVRFRYSLSISAKKKACWNFDRNQVESMDQFGENLHLNISSLPINEYGLSLHFRSYLISFSNILKFLLYKSCISFAKFNLYSF